MQLHSSNQLRNAYSRSQVQISRLFSRRLVPLAYTSEKNETRPAFLQQQRRTPARPEHLDNDEVWVPFRWPGQLGGNEVYVSGSWDGWSEQCPLDHTDSSGNNYPGDWTAAYKLKVGQHEYKFNVDGVWKVAPADPLVMDPEGNINNKRLCVRNCRLEFSFPTNSPLARSQRTAVTVTGTWSNWARGIPMMKISPNLWCTELSLPPGEYQFRFAVGEAANTHWACSDKYDVTHITNREGKQVVCNKVSIGVAPAFYLYYATGWQHCTLMYRLLKDGQLLDPDAPWQAVAMDDSPSRAEPCGEGSRWKQAIIALPGEVKDQSEADQYSLQFFMQGPYLSEVSSDDESSARKAKAKRRPPTVSNNGNGGSNGRPQSGDATARHHEALAANGSIADLRKLVKVDTPDKTNSNACYLLRWPGGWKLQKGSVTKFLCVTKPPVLLCADIDGTMVNEHPDLKEQFWMDSRTKEFQEYWESSAALARSVLVFNTGRSKGQLIWLLQQKPMLAVPDVLITAVGTKIWYLPDGMRCFQDPTEVEWIEDKLWSQRLDEGWDLKLALDAAGEMFKPFNRDSERVKWLDKGEEHPHRVALQVNTAVLDSLLERLQEGIDKRKLQARIIISGAGDWRYVDVVHQLAGKLEALEWVRQMYGVPVERCATAGDSCNDILMLDGKCPAIVVGNAQEELVRWYHEQNDRGRIVLTDKPEATGVLEGLARHGLY